MRLRLAGDVVETHETHVSQRKPQVGAFVRVVAVPVRVEPAIGGRAPAALQQLEQRLDAAPRRAHRTAFAHPRIRQADAAEVPPQWRAITREVARDNRDPLRLDSCLEQREDPLRNRPDFRLGAVRTELRKCDRNLRGFDGLFARNPREALAQTVAERPAFETCDRIRGIVRLVEEDLGRTVPDELLQQLGEQPRRFGEAVHEDPPRGQRLLRVAQQCVASLCEQRRAVTDSVLRERRESSRRHAHDGATSRDEFPRPGTLLEQIDQRRFMVPSEARVEQVRYHVCNGRIAVTEFVEALA